MATLVFSAIGTLLGGPLGGVIGALAGRQVDSLVFRPAGREGPRLNELAASTSSYGLAIPRQFGTMRVAGQIIWATDLVEHRERHGGGKGRPSTTTYSYTASFAVALSSRPVGAVGRVWADGKLLRGAAGDLKVGGTMRLHSGLGDQGPDPLIAAAEGAARCPAWRGLAYVVFEDLQLADFGNRIPALTFEVLADSAPLSVAQLLDGVVEDYSAAIPLTGLAGLGAEGSPAEVLAMLDPVFPIDCNACGDSLELSPELAQTTPIALPEAATSTAREDFGGNAGYARNRAALMRALPQMGLSDFHPPDGAFYIYADIGRFTNDSLDFSKRLLEEAGVAATPGVDFDRARGHRTLRLSYAGSEADIAEAIERMAGWLKGSV